MDIWLAAKPGELSLGEVAMALLGGGDGGLFGEGSFDYGDCLAVAEGVKRLDGSVSCEKAAGFFNESGGKHCFGTQIEALVKLRSRRVEADAQQTEAGEGIACHDLRKRPARGDTDLDGANELGRVVGVDSRGGCWVETGEEAMQPCRAVMLATALQTRAKVFLSRGTGKEAIREGAQIEAGSAGDDGKALARSYPLEGLTSKAAIFSGGERLVGIGDVDEVMRQACAVGGRGLGGADVHAAIDGDGVATDDFAVEALGKLK